MFNNNNDLIINLNRANKIPEPMRFSPIATSERSGLLKTGLGTTSTSTNTNTSTSTSTNTFSNSIQRQEQRQQQRQQRQQKRQQRLQLIKQHQQSTQPTQPTQPTQSTQPTQPTQSTDFLRSRPLPPLPPTSELVLINDNSEFKKFMEEFEESLKKEVDQVELSEESNTDLSDSDDEQLERNISNQEKKLESLVNSYNENQLNEPKKIYPEVDQPNILPRSRSVSQSFKISPKSEKEKSYEEKMALKEFFKRLAGTRPESSPFKEEMEKDYLKFNTDIFSETKSKLAPKPFDLSCANNYSSLSSFGDNLLNNAQDKEDHKDFQVTTNTDKSLVRRLANAEKKYIQEIVDNFDETNNHLIKPQYIIEEFIKIKNRLMQDPDTSLNGMDSLVNLSRYCINNQLINQIEKLYRTRYGYEPFEQPVANAGFIPRYVGLSNSRCFQMERGKLYSVLDFLINKYRCLSDDRKILNQVDELGEEMADTVKEYQEIHVKIAKYERFINQATSVRNSLIELAKIAQDPEYDFFNSVMDLNLEVVEKIEKLEDNVNRDKINKLTEEAKQCQAKFNYYQKMSNEIMKRVDILNSVQTSIIIPTSPTICSYPEFKNLPILSSVPNHQLRLDPPNQLSFDPPSQLRFN